MLFARDLIGSVGKTSCAMFAHPDRNCIAPKEPLPGILRRANKLWWTENVRWTFQDQISWPFVLHQLGIGVDLIRGNLWRNYCFDWIPHNSDN